MPSLSIIVPLFNERDSIPGLLRELREAMAEEELQALFAVPFSYEIIIIDDGSTDDSATILTGITNTAPEVRLVSMQRNYGKTAALSTGFGIASGDYICTIDADLQDDPFAIKTMIRTLQDGSDLVSGWKVERHDPLTKTIPSRFFNAVTRTVTGISIHDFNCGLKVYRQQVVRHLHLHGDMHRYIPVLAERMGFRIAEVPVRHRARQHGQSKYGTYRLFTGLFDFLSVLFITRYIGRPMHFFGMAGLCCFFSGFLISLTVTIEKLAFMKPAGNRPILFLGILLIILGVQLFSTGLIGEMLSASTAETIPRIIRATANLDPEQQQRCSGSLQS